MPQGSQNLRYNKVVEDVANCFRIVCLDISDVSQTCYLSGLVRGEVVIVYIVEDAPSLIASCRFVKWFAVSGSFRDSTAKRYFLFQAITNCK